METWQELPVLSDGRTPRYDERGAAAVEELATARAQEQEDVLEVGCGARPAAERRRIERAAASGEEDEARETAADLEAARAEVLVGQPIAREVKDRAQQDRRDPRPAGGTGRGASRYVKRDDHGYPRSFMPVRKHLIVKNVAVRLASTDARQASSLISSIGPGGLGLPPPFATRMSTGPWA